MANSIVVCTWDKGRDGTPSGVEQTLSLAAPVADSAGLDLVWAVVGPAPECMTEIACAYGVVRIDRIEDTKLEEFSADACVETLSQYIRARQPRLVLVPQTSDSRVVAPRAAVRSDAAVLMNALEVAIEGDKVRVVTSAYGGNTRVEQEQVGGLCIVGVLSDVLSAEPPVVGGSEPAVEQVAVDLSDVEERVRVIEKAHFEGPRLEDAQIVVAGGMGLGNKENFRLVEELAEALGGMAAASRPAVENGFIDASRQVGLTGKITRPVLYIGAGISGASQHMVGCSGAKTLVAINTNADAAIFRYARYGIVGDALEVLPEITKAVRTT